MDGGHGAAVDSESFLENFGYGSEAVGGAGSVGNDVVRRGIVGLVVHAENEGSIRAIGGSGDDDFFDRSAKMLLGVDTLGEKPGGLDNDVRAYGSPIDLGGIRGLGDLEAFSFHRGGGIGSRGVGLGIARGGCVARKECDG